MLCRIVCGMSFDQLSISVVSYPMQLPEVRRGPGRVANYPFDTLGVNHHFTAFNRAPSTMRSAISRYYRKHGKEKRFVQRIGPGGYPTVWRVK